MWVSVTKQEKQYNNLALFLSPLHHGNTHQVLHLLLPLCLQIVHGARCLDEDLGLPEANEGVEVVVSYHLPCGLLIRPGVGGPGLVPDDLVPVCGVVCHRRGS